MLKFHTSGPLHKLALDGGTIKSEAGLLIFITNTPSESFHNPEAVIPYPTTLGELGLWAVGLVGPVLRWFFAWMP
jgi:hypothetical protein